MESKKIVQIILETIVGKFLTFKVLIVFIVIICIIAVLEAVSDIPIVGSTISDELKEGFEKIGVGVVNEKKIETYLDYENGSYLKSIQAKGTVYQESFDITNGGERENGVFENPSISETEYTLSLEEYSRPYRLWWQALASIDITGLGSNETTTNVIDSVKEQLSPIYQYTFEFDGNVAINSTVNDVDMTKTIVKTETYTDGELTSTTIVQTNSKALIPAMGIKSVSTMFDDIQFTYTLQETINETSTTETSETKTENTIFDDIQFEDLLEQTINGTAAETTDTKTETGQNKSKTVVTHTTTTTEHKYYSNMIQESETDNTRFVDYFTQNNKENGNVYKQSEPLMAIQIAEGMNDSYEYVAAGYDNFDYKSSYRYIKTMEYTGSESGNYKVTDADTKYALPLKFAAGVTEDQKQIAIGSYFGEVRTITVNGVTKQDVHKGIDISVPTGTPVLAGGDGVVMISKYSSSAGYYIVIKHEDGYYTRYLHNSKLLVDVGDEVRKGDVIALSGSTGFSTGSHIHFEVLVYDGTAINPMQYLPLEKIGN